MKSYSSIEKYNLDHLGKHIFAFEKIDGSNFRTEWNRKLSKKSSFTLGFSKFGTRNQMIHKNSPFIEAVGIFENKFAEDLDRIFREDKIFRGVERITVFGEFYGPRSFAGRHDWVYDVEDFNIKIFDVFLYKKDYLPPSDFIKVFENIDTPYLLYSGELSNKYIESVYNEPDGEGIVYKGVENGKVFMGKIKTQYWLNKVKELYGETEMLEY